MSIWRVLMLEDSLADAKLVLHELRRSGRTIESQRVETAHGMRALLREGTWDVIVSDWSMPSFDAPAALEVLKQSELDIPFLIVSGTVGEEHAVAAMRAGAHDYILKDKLARLNPAIERELREHDARSAHREMEKALRASELRFRRIFDSGITGITVADLSGTLVEANDAFLEMVGYTREDLEAGLLSWKELTPPEQRGVGPTISELDEGAGSRPFEKEYLRKNGSRIPVLVGIAVLEEARTLAVITDLTARKIAEQRKAAVVDAAIDAVVAFDHCGVITEFNPAAERTYGYPRDEAMGRTFAELLLPRQDMAETQRIFADLVASGQGAVVDRRVEVVNVRRDGSEIPVELSISVVGGSDPPTFVAFVRDQSEQRRVATALLEKNQANASLEEQLRQSQKMEAVGRLAGGIAHDFNNMLSVVLSYSELVGDELSPGDPMKEDVEEIRQAALRAADLTRQLLMFSRQQVLAPRVLDLNEVLLRMDKMLRRVLGEDISLVSLTPASLGRVRADPTSVEQVIMNLVVNARDAMPRGGKLTMETADVILDDSFAESHLAATPGPYVVLSVTDTGAGMDKATVARIFEPFFTTKEKGKGTGLGLSTVFGIVQQSGGHIWVYSEVAIGTTFKIYLPRVDASVERPRPTSTPKSVRGTETILLVEDEEQVRNVARGILRRHGYTVLEAQNGGEALLICERHQETIHLLLTDVVMPQMSGPELVVRLAKVRPDMSVLCMSGYTDDAATRHGLLDAELAYLQKPFTVDSLTSKVREVLDARGTTAE